jgi:hypothetical protein
MPDRTEIAAPRGNRIADDGRGAIPKATQRPVEAVACSPETPLDLAVSPSHHPRNVPDHGDPAREDNEDEGNGVQ